MLQFSPRRLIWLLVILAIVGLMVFAVLPAPIPVDLEPVKRGALTVTVDAEGKTRVRQRSIVSAPVTGRLSRIALNEGDRVEQGALIARIDPLPHDAAVREARARIAEWRAQRAGVETLRPKQQSLLHIQARIAAATSAQRESEAKVGQASAALEQAQREVRRAKRLEVAGAISQEERETLELLTTTRSKELEAAQLEVQRTAAEVKAAQAELAVLEAEQRDPDYLLDVYSARIASIEAELARLQDEAKRTEILAPVSAQVLRVLEEHERVVTAGTPLLELGDLSQLELVVDLLSTDSVNVQVGARVWVEDWGGDKTLQARVRLVEPSAFTKVSALGVEEQRVNVIADFIDAPVPLGDGYRVEARIVIWQGESVLTVPLSALFRCSENWCVFAVVDDSAQRRSVALGQRNSVAAEVLDGLQEGDLVIRYPTDELREGTRVKTR
ncbi:MAG: HlyD family efflux transporter periplasmic adaptor subunit [Candidatus Tectomicrobia bacterium]|nr:HlyD family efflux transporter periplasmic adaptor subunit [Candidatus Tectomicrobia bacterium]